MIIAFFIVALWLMVFIKKLLFWIWLWQIKQYYAKRMLDHFRTAQGKKLIFNFLNLAKLVSIPGIIFLFQPFVFIIAIIYVLETAVFGYRFLGKSFKYPVLTKKAILILTSGFVLAAAVLSLLFSLAPLASITFFVVLLIFDLFSPLIFAGLVLPWRVVNIIFEKKIIVAAKKKREKMSGLIVVGITGSYGKTSTKDILTAILSEKFKVFKTLEHLNTDPAIAQYILDKLDSSYQVFVAEIAAYFKGGVKSACDFVQPKIGILTGINQQHLALFGSQETIINTKYELIEYLPKNGLAVFNADNKYCLELYQKTQKPKKIYSLKNNLDGIIPDVWAENINISKTGSSFKAVFKNGQNYDFQIKLLGQHNILNILGAVCVAKEMGMGLEQIATACGRLESKLGGMVLKQGINGLNILDSSYSANSDGVISALDYLKIWEGRKIIVMPCLIELGRASKEVHQEIGKKISQVCDLAIITTKDRFQEIKTGAVSQGMDEKNILFIANPEEITKKIKDFCQNGDVVLLEGRVPGGLVKQLTINN